MSDRSVFVASIYVNADDCDVVLTAVQQGVGGTPSQLGTVMTAVVDIEVQRNPDTSRVAVHVEDKFLYFPCLVELYAGDDLTDPVQPVLEVLGALDDLGVEYVTAADFEGDLPRNGTSA